MAQRTGTALVLVVAALALLLGAVPAGAAEGDSGVEGNSFQGGASGVTGEKPESKLWFADGSWWSTMYDPASTDYHIFELQSSTQQWRDTGVRTDARAGSKADTLWVAEENKLYVASHVFSTSAATGYPSRLYRYSFDPVTRTYSLDAGFPATINNARSETLVLARDSIGRLWATWMQGSKLHVTHTICSTTCDDRQWATPFTPAVNGTTGGSDDIASIVALPSGHVGILWSNQPADAFYFTLHADSAAPSTWAPSEIALSGPNMADDHVNLAAHPSGRLFAAVKTSRSGSTDPLVGLLERSTAGAWTFHRFGEYRNHHTRPIVQLDVTNDVVHVLATSGEAGGTIYRKTSPADAISFAPGLGDVFLRDADDNDLNNATGTKQHLTAQSGMLVLASHQTTKRYWHAFDPLGGSTPENVAPSARADTYVAEQDVELVVAAPGVLANDTDADGDPLTAGIVTPTEHGSVVLEADGAFRYTPTPGFTGTDSFSYAASDGEASSPPVSVTLDVRAPGLEVVVTPARDAYVRSNAPDTNYGTATTLRTYRGGTNQTDTYLTFDVSGVGAPVTGAVLRLRVTDASPAGGSVRLVPDDDWIESTLTWNNRPTVTDAVGTVGPAAAGTWVEVDVTAAVDGDGTHTLAIVGASGDAAFFASRETSSAPQLVITTG